jgi:hypothetical protein
VLGVSLSVSQMEKATVESDWMGCAELWQGVGSIDLKLQVQSVNYYFFNGNSAGRTSFQRNL